LNDFIGFVSLPLGSESSDHGLLVVNHEFTSSRLMFPGSPAEDDISAEQVATDIAAHGLSVVEIKRDSRGEWRVVLDSSFNRRITPETPVLLTGPAAGSERLRTNISNDGSKGMGQASLPVELGRKPKRIAACWLGCGN